MEPKPSTGVEETRCGIPFRKARPGPDKLGSSLAPRAGLLAVRTLGHRVSRFYSVRKVTSLLEHLAQTEGGIDDQNCLSDEPNCIAQFRSNGG